MLAKKPRFQAIFGWFACKSVSKGCRSESPFQAMQETVDLASFSDRPLVRVLASLD